MPQLRLSCGIFLLSRKSGKLHVCVVKKRHTYSIMDILGGTYSSETVAHVVNTMSTREQSLLSSFDAMWVDVWGALDIATDMYQRGKAKYTELRPDTVPILNSTEPIYEIPKGRPNLREPILTCAMREHSEETGIVPADYEIMQPFPQLRYYFTDMGKLYKYIYFIAYSGECRATEVSNCEIDHVRWLSLTELNKLYTQGQFPVYKWVRSIFRKCSTIAINTI